MRPEAHIAAAIEVFEAILAGAPAEPSLTTWARKHRFAGSGDRAAIRDIVFDALRRRRSYGWLGGQDTARGLMAGRLIYAGTEPGDVFTGIAHAPSPLSVVETDAMRESLDVAPQPVALDCPDWLWPVVVEDLGKEAGSVFTVLRDRAPVFLRVNLQQIDVDGAMRLLSNDGIETEPHTLSKSALAVTSNERRLRASRAYTEGMVELQDAASQAVVDLCVSHLRGGRVLDFCSGGGGKALALAGAGVTQVSAHDADPGRMKDIPERARRAGTPIEILQRAEGTYDLVLCDAPCSGSGAWRRQPEAKWRLDQSRLDMLAKCQDDILDKALDHVAPDGHLAYATCSIFALENEQRIAAFLTRHPDWSCVEQRRWSLLEGGDGFFAAILQKS